tara:strand:+ start:2756 stop:3109 length:354 start_codon:yes stop_codon:yes gene_type:complete
MISEQKRLNEYIPWAFINFPHGHHSMGQLITGQAATYVEEMHVNTKKRYEIMCITRDVERIVAESGIKDGLVLVNPMHITASCYVNDLEYGLHHDIMKWLEKIAPFHGIEGRSGFRR